MKTYNQTIILELWTFLVQGQNLLCRFSKRTFPPKQKAWIEQWIGEHDCLDPRSHQEEHHKVIILRRVVCEQYEARKIKHQNSSTNEIACPRCTKRRFLALWIVLTFLIPSLRWTYCSAMPLDQPVYPKPSEKYYRNRQNYQYISNRGKNCIRNRTKV